MVARVFRPRSRTAPAAIWLPGLLVVAATFIPAWYLAKRSTERGWDPWARAIENSAVPLMTRSLTLALVVAVASVLVAVPAAWLTTRAALPGRRAWAVLMAAPLAIPSYIMAMTVVDFLGPRGTLQGWLEPLGVERLPEIYGFWGSAFTLTAASFPYVYLVLRAAFATADVSEEEASRSLGAGPLRTFFRVVLPGLVPAIAAGVLLVVLYTLSDFGAVSTLNYDTFTRSIFVEYQTSFDRTGAAVLGAMLAMVAAAILAAELTVRGRMGRRASRRQSLMRPVPLGRWKWPAAGLLALIALLSLGRPWACGLLAAEGPPANANFPEIGSAARHSVTMASVGRSSPSCWRSPSPSWLPGTRARWRAHGTGRLPDPRAPRRGRRPCPRVLRHQLRPRPLQTHVDAPPRVRHPLLRMRSPRSAPRSSANPAGSKTGRVAGPLRRSGCWPR